MDGDGVVMASHDIQYFTWRNVVLMAPFFHLRMHLGSLVFANMLLYFACFHWPAALGCIQIYVVHLNIYGIFYTLATCYFFLDT